MRVEQRITVDASPDAVWTFIGEPGNYRQFMAGITRWDVESETRKGLGARYAMRMKVGSAEIGGLVEVVEFDEPYEIAWTGVTGIDQRGRWRLHERDDGGTDVTLRLRYHAEGGLLGSIAERLAAPIVGANLRRSLEELKRRLSG
jgi:carbon monoxide dehydrogenase subunit G